jgi:probable HAF family extracellular repeat protein
VKLAIPIIAVSILVLATSSSTTALPKHYAYTDLGVLCPSAGVRCAAINNACQIAGTSANPMERAFFWQSSAGTTNLGTFGGDKSNAYAVNTAGTVVGQARNSLGVYRPFISRQGAGMSDLGISGGTYCSAHDINDAEQVVGFVTTSDWYGRAFIWQQGPGMTTLGTMGGIWNEAWAVNNSGNVVGVERTGASDHQGWYTRAFIWDTNNGIRELPGLGGNRNAAYDINESGQAVGVVETVDRVSHAALWPDTTHVRDLGALGGTPGSTSIARGINNLGLVVGASDNSSGVLSAFIWEEGAGMVDLNTMLKNPPANARLSDASAINDAGWIVGLASLTNGETHLCILAPTAPEPGSLLIMGAGLLSLFASIKRRSRMADAQC